MRKIGFTDVELEEPETCRREECNIGNLISDAFSLYFEEQRVNNSLESECNNTLALINGGNIRSSISKGNITYKAVISTLPFNNELGLLHAKGSDLIDIFKASANQYRKGGFMQVSGFKVSYNLTNDKLLVLDKLQVNCKKGWQDIVANFTYLVVLNDFIAKGGDNYTMINPDNFINYMYSDAEVLTKHIEKVQNATTLIENRVVIVDKSSAASRLLQINMIVIFLIQVLWNKRYTTEQV